MLLNKSSPIDNMNSSSMNPSNQLPPEHHARPGRRLNAEMISDFIEQYAGHAVLVSMALYVAVLIIVVSR